MLHNFPGPWLCSAEAILGEREQLWVINSQYWQQLGGGSTSPVKGVWAGHQECSLLTQNERMMIHWLVNILNKPVHFVDEESDVQREGLKSISSHPLRALSTQFDQILTSSHLPASEHSWHFSLPLPCPPRIQAFLLLPCFYSCFCCSSQWDTFPFFSTSNYSLVS